MGDCGVGTSNGRCGLAAPRGRSWRHGSHAPMPCPRSLRCSLCWKGPCMSDRSVTGVDIDDRMKTVLRTEAAIRTSAIAAGFVTTSVHTWLKIPDLDDLEDDEDA